MEMRKRLEGSVGAQGSRDAFPNRDGFKYGRLRYFLDAIVFDELLAPVAGQIKQQLNLMMIRQSSHHDVDNQNVQVADASN